MDDDTTLLPLRIRILALLNQHEHRSAGLHGYAMTQELGVSTGSLYPVLFRLVGAGYVELTEKGTHQKVYRLTPDGSQVLERARAELAPDRSSLTVERPRPARPRPRPAM